MLKRKKKVCLGCCKDQYIFAKGLCEYCYRIKYNKKWKQDTKAMISNKAALTKKAISVIERDNAFYEEIWSERKHVCAECGIHLGNEWRRFHFSHILSKGSHPALRWIKLNIDLLCLKHHHQWEFGDKKSMKIWLVNSRLITILKSMYKYLVKNQ